MTATMARKRIPYDRLQRVHIGPTKVVRACSKCGAVIHTRQRGGGGRGAAFREGNQGNGLTLKHWRDSHPGELEGLL